MPIYEYECSECGHSLEAIQKMSDSPLSECPKCGHNALKKLVSAPSFRLKGGGWYETDFKQDKRRNIAESGSSGAKAGTSSSSSVVDSKNNTTKSTNEKSSSATKSTSDK